jgi:hypothetical protein
MTTFPVNYEIKELAITSYTLGNIYYALSTNLVGTIDEVVLPARAYLDEQATGSAPWLNGSTWYYWHSVEQVYKPMKRVTGTVYLDSNPSADQYQVVQNKNGIIATMDNAYGADQTIILPEGSVSVDWDMGKNFSLTLARNRDSRLQMTHSKDGMSIKILVVNRGTSAGLIWDASNVSLDTVPAGATMDTAPVQWPGSPPTIPPAQPGSSSSVLITFRNILGTVYGESWSQEAAADKRVTDATHYSQPKNL